MNKSTNKVRRLVAEYLESPNKEVQRIVKKELGVDVTIGAIKSIKNRLRKKFGHDADTVRESLLKEECELTGIPLETVRHYWYKSKKFSIFAKPDTLSIEDVCKKLTEAVSKHTPKYPSIKRKKSKDPHLLVIDPADVHLGKLSVFEETGETYNIEIAKNRVLEGVKTLIEKSHGFDIEKILLVVGNDIIHIDDAKRKATTSGTVQDTDGLWWQMFLAGQDLYVKLIELLLQVADVHVVHCPSNHDFTSGWYLAQTLEAWFHNSKQVTFDSSVKHRKYLSYGKNLIGLSHGDGAKPQDMPLLMASEEPEKWAKSKFRHIYLHHLHHKIQYKWKSGEDYHGATVEYLRTPSVADRWHFTQGYVAVPKAVEAFVHHPSQGQVCRLTCYF